MLADQLGEPSCQLDRLSCWRTNCVNLSCTLIRPPGSLIDRLPGVSVGEGPWLNPLFSPVHTCEARCQPYHKPPLRYPILIMRRSARGWPLVGIGSFTLYRLLIIALMCSRVELSPVGYLLLIQSHEIITYVPAVNACGINSCQSNSIIL